MVAEPGDERPFVVIGGGMVGLSIAFYLAESGLPVEVLERHTVGSGASWGNAGWVCASHSAPIPAPGVVRYALASLGRPASPFYLRPLFSWQFASWLLRFSGNTNARRFARGYAALAMLNQPTFELFEGMRRSGVETTLRRPGMVHAFLSNEAAAKFLQTQRAMTSAGYAVPDAPLSGSDVASLDASLVERVSAGYLVAGEGVIDPARITRSLSKAITERGGMVHEHAEVTGFVLEGDRAVGVRTSVGDFPCSGVAIAAGSWSASLLAQLRVRLPLQAGKGYSFSVELETPPVHPMYLGDRKIAVSPIDGTTRIAGTMELSGNNRALDWRRIIAIAMGSRDYLGPWFNDPDDLATQIRDPWVGARPLLPDGLPVIDRLPVAGNAYVATGHGMLGMTLGPVTGATLADYVMTGQRPEVLEPFRVDRW